MDIQNLDLNEIFDIRSPNEWIRESRSLPVPRKLFGDLWQEGEVAIMFADTAKGKSVLSIQIAESVARGIPIYPFEMTAKAQRVLYLDFELTGKQFEMRYTEDHDERYTHLKKPHQFSERCKRVELRPEILQRHEGRPIEEALRDLIEPLVVRSKAKVLIIDNITYLKRSAESSREAVPLMKELQRLKRRHGLSILVVAHTPKRDARRPLVVNDLQGSKVIANYADNIFAIGQCRHESAERYIKHIKPRSVEIIYDENHSPVFRLKKIGGNFLGFEFAGFSTEAEMLREPSGSEDLTKIRLVKGLQNLGKTIRQIAEETGFSRSAVHRYLQRWHPSMETTERPDSAEYSISDFPGKEEYDEASKDPRLNVGFTRMDVEAKFRRREHYLIQLASADARTAYKKTGVAPKLDEHEKYRAFKDAVAAYYATGEVREAIEQWVPEQLTNAQCTMHNEESNEINIGQTVPESEDSMSDELSTVSCPLAVAIDGYGREILVESQLPSGKPLVWYRIDEKGLKRRHERKGFTIITDIVDEIAMGP